MKIALVAPDDLSFWLFRRGLIRALKGGGHEVTLIGAAGAHQIALESLGARFIPLAFPRFMSPAGDVRLFFALWRIFRTERFDLVHNFTAKPNLYAALAAFLAGVRRIYNSVTGLGAMVPIDGRSVLRSPSRLLFHILYALASRLASRTWFQNPDDLNYFVAKHLIPAERAVLIRSSGIDLSEWTLTDGDTAVRSDARTELGLQAKHVAVMLVSRALPEKGVREFIEAAELLETMAPEARFFLVGPAETEDRRSLSPQFLKALRPNFRWLGERRDVRRLLTAAEIVCLPSYYREGVPRSLLEGMALGLPVVTTDAPGCREVVIDGQNGLSVSPRDPKSLAQALAKLIASPEKRRAMGQASRRIVAAEFSEERVVKAIMENLYAVPLTARIPRQVLAKAG